MPTDTGAAEPGTVIKLPDHEQVPAEGPPEQSWGALGKLTPVRRGAGAGRASPYPSASSGVGWTDWDAYASA
jgi:hypothetical protein